MTTTDRCSATMHRGEEFVRCELPAGHSELHSGRTNRSYIEWEAAPGEDFSVPAVGGPSDAERRAVHADIEVDMCIFCHSDDVATTFVFLQPVGLRVAVPGRIGLCSACLELLRNDEVQAVVERTRGTAFDDFADGDVIPLIRATAAALPD